MDDVTHILAGTLIARANPSQRKGLTLACVAGALIPDSDVLLTLWGRHFYVTEHRGFTHSLWGLAPMSLLAAGVVWSWVRRKPDRASFGMIWLFAFIGVVSHILLDWCTSWGTMIFWPDRTRFALDQLFIIDLWYAVCFILPLAAGFIWKGHRVVLSWIGIGLVLTYHGLTAFNHHWAIESLRRERPQAWVAAFPQPFSPFRWSVFAREDGVLIHKPVDFMKSVNDTEEVVWKEPPITPEIQAVLDSPQGKKYLWFALVPVWEEEKLPDGSAQVRFGDLRFRLFQKGGEERRFGTVFRVKDGQVTGGDF